MARLSTIGFEIEVGVDFLEIVATSGNVPTRDTTFTRPGSGIASLKADSGATLTSTATLQNQALGTTSTLSFSAVDTYFYRGYHCFTSLPTTQSEIVWHATGGAVLSVQLKTTGKLGLYQGATQIGSDSAATIVADGTTWYRVELSWVRNTTTSINSATAQLDGVQIATGNPAIVPTAGVGSIGIGWRTAPGASIVQHIDDVAVNDNTGSSQTSFPGEGHVLLLPPVSDNARGANWTGGAGGTTNLWDAVNNTPPVGVTAPGTDAAQVINAASDTTGNYDANLTDYTTAGVTIADTISLVHPLWAIGTSTTGTCSIAMLLVSNPQANGGTEATLVPGVTAGTYPTSWKNQSVSTQVVYAPAVTLGTQPVIRVGKRTATAAITAQCCFMGAYVEVVRAPMGSLPFQFDPIPFMGGH